jgi:hypothetical protein
MLDYADLLIRLYKPDDVYYGIELRYYLPYSVIETDSANGKATLMNLVVMEETELKNPQFCHSQLTNALFFDPPLEKHLVKALSDGQSTNDFLHLRLQITLELPHIYNMHWG